MLPPTFDVLRLRVAERPSVGEPLMPVAMRHAARQHGVVSGDQLIDDGVSRSAITRAARGGPLVRRYRGVFAVGHDRLTPQGEWMAAVLAGGPGAVLSHRSAASAWGLRETARSAVDITVAGRRGYGQDGLTPHCCGLTPADRTALDGLPVTTVARTLLDLAEVVPFHHLRRAAERAEELRVFDLHDLHATIARSDGRRGLKPLRLLLDDLSDGPTHTRSELEAKALRLVRRAGLPEPSVNVIVEGLEVDLLWRSARVIVELDSWRHHGTQPAFERDRERDAVLQAAGYAVLRFTWRHVTRQPDRTAARIGALLARRPASEGR